MIAGPSLKVPSSFVAVPTAAGGAEAGCTADESTVFETSATGWAD